MYNLSNPFIMPETVMLRTIGKTASSIVGACHMGVSKPHDDLTMIGSCHMGVSVPDAKGDLLSRQPRHREVVALA